MSVPEDAVDAIGILVTIVTMNALVVYETVMPGTVKFEILVLTLAALFAFHAGLRELHRSALDASDRSSNRRDRGSDAPSIEAVKQRYVEDDEYTIYDMEDDMDELLEDRELE